ncbi:MAG: NAD-binding protein [Euryarchaeota archaeon]|nr:NAD-binding protein [Euryarchaeota archaeon]
MLLIIVYSVAFLIIMQDAEGRSYTEIDALYWIISTMTTQGTGDIVFTSQVGREFSILVQISGIILFFAVLIPIAVALVIQTLAESLPRKSRAKNHILIAGHNPMVETIIEELNERGLPYLIVDNDADVVRSLIERKIACICGDPSDEITLRNAQIDHAKKVILNQSDEKNAIVALVARKLTRSDIIGIVEDKANAVYLLYAGANKVVSPKQLLGIDIGRKAAMPITHQLVGSTPLIGNLRIFELPILTESGLDGTSIEDAKIRERTGATVVGLWKGSKLSFNPPPSETITDTTVLLLIGTRKQLDTAKELSMCTLDGTYCAIRGHYIIAGYGDVGKRASKVLRSHGIEHIIVDKTHCDVVGSSTDRAVLKEAGITEASMLLVTVNNDVDAIYTTLIARKLNPEIDIMCRAINLQSTEKLYRAGADYVFSQPVVAGQILAKFIEPGPSARSEREVLLSEDMKVIEYPPSPSLIGKSLKDLEIRSRTGCTVIAITWDSTTVPNPDPDQRITENSLLTVIGTREQIRQFKNTYS